MPIDAAAATAYYNSLPPDQQARVDAIGGPSVEWLKNAVNAGVPDAIRVSGGLKGATEGGWEDPGGYTFDPYGKNAADPSEWLGKRAPTPSEFRKWAGMNQDEDYARYSDRVVADLIKGFDYMTGTWKPGYGPTPGMKPGGDKIPAGGGPGGGGALGFAPGRGLGALAGGGAAPVFTPPSYEDFISSPGYQSVLRQGEDAIKRNASALGTLRTGGTLEDLTRFNQDLASQQYGNVFNRALQTYGTQYAPWELGQQQDLSRWTTQYGGNLARWQTQYGGNLQKYLQRENTIANLLSTPPPYYGG